MTTQASIRTIFTLPPTKSPTRAERIRVLFAEGGLSVARFYHACIVGPRRHHLCLAHGAISSSLAWLNKIFPVRRRRFSVDNGYCFGGFRAFPKDIRDSQLGDKEVHSARSRSARYARFALLLDALEPPGSWKGSHDKPEIASTSRPRARDERRRVCSRSCELLRATAEPVQRRSSRSTAITSRCSATRTSSSTSAPGLPISAMPLAGRCRSGRSTRSQTRTTSFQEPRTKPSTSGR